MMSTKFGRHTKLSATLSKLHTHCQLGITSYEPRFFYHGATAPSGSMPPHCLAFTIILPSTHHTRLDSSGRIISLTQGPLPVNPQHSQKTEIHSSGEIRTQNPSKRAAANPRLRPRGHWYREPHILTFRHRASCILGQAFRCSPENAFYILNQ